METFYKYTRATFFILLFSLFTSYDSVAQENSVAINIHDSSIEWGACPDIIPNGCNVAILQGDPTKANTDAVFKFQPNTDIPEHWHTNDPDSGINDGYLRRRRFKNFKSWLLCIWTFKKASHC
ncbi:hypothetical protein [Christiangramia echinicola]|uniref:Uncharacterized protein n=1 Tax=Christiangramia echinicola TaxID=279359 RepID=A0A1H1RWX6_9FLAO|nr:hypothetical protein [Christiangramia echinicola]SDS40185.1 hypothetical protein SAMN04488552_3054 [Christiangramia echinicola]